MGDNLLMSAKCKCGAIIRYVRMKKSGKLMPVSDGVVKIINPDEPVLLITFDGEMIRTKEYGDEGYEPHWATCPFGANFRKAANAKASKRPEGKARETPQGSLSFGDKSDRGNTKPPTLRSIDH